MSDEINVKIGPPQNEDFRDVWDQLNKFIEKLIVATKKIPKPKELKSDEQINQPEVIGKASKEIKQLEKELNPLLEQGFEILGNPNLEFENDVDVRLSTSNYLNLLSLRISYAEKNYLQAVYDIQRIEDFIHKHNSKLQAEKSLSYGRKSIWLGLAGIILGIVSTLFNLSQHLNPKPPEAIENKIAPILIDSSSAEAFIDEADSINIDKEISY